MIVMSENSGKHNAARCAEPDDVLLERASEILA